MEEVSYAPGVWRRRRSTDGTPVSDECWDGKLLKIDVIARKLAETYLILKTFKSNGMNKIEVLHDASLEWLNHGARAIKPYKAACSRMHMHRKCIEKKCF
jgi:hypothetical protein